jgi:hypothetical protein
MEISEDLFALCAPIGYALDKGIKSDGFISGKQLSLEDGAIMLIENESPLPAEVDDVLRFGEILFR